MTEGWINDVNNACFAMPCWEKSDAETFFGENPPAEEYKGITGIIDGLIMEGSVLGIYAIENAETVLLRFLDTSHNDSFYDLDRELISFINDRAVSFEQQKTDIIKARDGLLSDLPDYTNDQGQENE